MEDAFQSMEDDNPSFSFDLSEYTLKAFVTMQVEWEHVTNFFNFGQTHADEKYFATLEGQV